jgi:hypothetical protein
MLQWYKRCLDVLLVLFAVAVAAKVIVFSTDPQTKPESQPSKPIALASHLFLPNVSWTAPRNVVLAISSTCPACRESERLYSTLSRMAKERADLRVIVVAQSTDAGIAQWLNQANIHPSAIVQLERPVQYGFTETPAIYVVNNAGVVTDVLMRHLTQVQELSLWARLDGRSSHPLDLSFTIEEVDAAAVNKLVDGTGAQIVDIRERRLFDRQRNNSAINIPADELVVRGPIELRAGSTIIIDCKGIERAPCKTSAEGLVRVGFQVKTWIHR